MSCELQRASQQLTSHSGTVSNYNGNSTPLPMIVPHLSSSPKTGTTSHDFRSIAKWRAPQIVRVHSPGTLDQNAPPTSAQLRYHALEHNGSRAPTSLEYFILLLTLVLIWPNKLLSLSKVFVPFWMQNGNVSHIPVPMCEIDLRLLWNSNSHPVLHRRRTVVTSSCRAPENVATTLANQIDSSLTPCLHQFSLCLVRICL